MNETQTQLQLPEELTNIAPFQHWATFPVKTDGDVELAGGAIKEIADQLKKVKAKQTELFGPLKKAIKDFEEKVREVTSPLDILSRTLRGRVTAFWDEREATLRAEAKKQREADLAAETAKQEAAQALAMTTGDEKALKEADQRSRNIEKLETKPLDVSQTVRSSAFTMAQSKAWKWKLVNPKLVPKDFWILDEKALNKIARSQKKDQPFDVPGIEFYQESRTVIK